MSNRREDSLKKKYVYKLSTNLAGLGIGIFTQAIIPRGLGPKLYGDYNFLINFFTQIVNFFDMGSSQGFYTKLSQRPNEPKLVSFYLYFAGFVTVAFVALVVLAQSLGLGGLLWPDQLMRYVFSAVFLAILIWAVGLLTRIADAYGLTIASEVAKMTQRLFGLAVLALLFVWNVLSLAMFFVYNYCVLFLLAGAICAILRSRGYGIFQNWKMDFSEVKKYTAEFYVYSSPFFLYSLIGMGSGIFDRWLLQVCGGSVEQGFFGLSYQIGAICFMFTSAMTPLITRELSIAYNNKDVKLMAQLFRKHVPLLYSITAMLACFVAINADKVTIVMGGGQFKGAILAVAIMAFCPIHQVYGQLSGSVFYASERTMLYCNIGIAYLLLSMPVTYFLIAPKTLLGLDAGAVGLACKTVLMQFFAVNAQLYCNSRLLGLSFWKYFAHQFVSIIAFLMIAAFARLTTDYMLNVRSCIMTNFIACGILYLIMALILIYFAPIVIGAKRSDLHFYRVSI